jgi:hypothetical protein
MSKRRVKGEGSVYKRGDGRIVDEYEDANGKDRYISGKTLFVQLPRGFRTRKPA